MTQKSNSVDIKFQVLTSLITAVIIFFFLFKAEKRFCTTEQAPITYRFDQNYTNQIKIQTGLTIEDFSEFKVIDNNFNFFGTIWFEFDPKEIALKNIEDFAFEHGEIISKSKPIIQDVNNKKRAIYNINVKFKSKLNYKYFPFDDHKIFLILTNKTTYGKKIIYETGPSNLKISPTMALANWKLKETKVTSGYDILKLQENNESTTLTYPQVVYELDFNRIGFRYTLIILLPLLFIFFLEMLSFVVSHREEGFHSALIQVSVADIAALFAYRFVVEMISPQVGYFMISDYLFFLFLGTSFIVYNINNLGLYLSKLQKSILSIILQGSVAGCIGYLLNIWMVCN